MVTFVAKIRSQGVFGRVAYFVCVSEACRLLLDVIEKKSTQSLALSVFLDKLNLDAVFFASIPYAKLVLRLEKRPDHYNRVCEVR